jgi:hypothetical protein
MTSQLFITIPQEPPFFSLYAEGPFLYKVFVKELNSTRLLYRQDEVIVLYYTYPTHREACVIRNTPPAVSRTWLPGLSKKVSVLFSVNASRVDKLRRAVGFLKTHASLSLPDAFYFRLYFIILQRGKLNYPALRALVNFSLSKEPV